MNLKLFHVKGFKKLKNDRKRPLNWQNQPFHICLNPLRVRKLGVSD